MCVDVLLVCVVYGYVCELCINIVYNKFGFHVTLIMTLLFFFWWKGGGGGGKEVVRQTVIVVLCMLALLHVFKSTPQNAYQISLNDFDFVLK